MELKPGAKLGPYEILSSLGEGGMGQVWKARDTRLDRIVAIKTSSSRFSERFEREARAVAALNHANICTLYDVGSDALVPSFLVMEYVEGAELKGPLPLDQALKYAIQLAGALEAAHRATITHRDLKPANIMIAKAGVKVLDFGLARREQKKTITEDDATLTRALTQEGSIVGTLQYMAPEQIQGKLIDTRADIFSFGCVLYEMVASKRAFGGANTASVIAAILERPAPSVEGVAPASLDRLLKRCLAKDPDDRYQSARDIRAELEWIAGTAESLAKNQVQTRSPRLAWGVAALAIVAACAVSFVHFREKPPETPVTRFSISAPDNTTFPPAGLPATLPALSPDGRKIAFRAVSADGKAQLWIRTLDAVAAQPIASTEDGYAPFWSPDGKSIGFAAGGKLKRIDTAGGPAQTLGDAGPVPFNGTWNSEGTILFSRGSGGPLLKISASGGTETEASRLDTAKETHLGPWFLPDGKNFLFLSASKGGAKALIKAGSLGSLDNKTLGETDGLPVEYASGYLLFTRGATLMAQPFDASRLATTGDAIPVAEQIHGNFSASSNGTLVYAPGATPQRQLTWFDRTGKRLASLGEPGLMIRLNFSPDRRNAAVIEADGIVWIYDMTRGVRTRSNLGAKGGSETIWSPDGSTIVYNGYDGAGLYRKASNGAGTEELLYKDNLNKDTLSFSPDGKFLAYDAAGDRHTHTGIWILPDPLGPVGVSKPYPLIHTEANEADPQISPDGKWIVWESDESGRNEIYAAQFPSLGGKQLISAKGGASPRWRRDGSEIFYLAPGITLTATSVSLKGGALEVGETHPLFREPVGSYRYDVSADGQKILALVPPEQQGPPPPLTLVLNWTAALKK